VPDPLQKQAEDGGGQAPDLMVIDGAEIDRFQPSPVAPVFPVPALRFAEKSEGELDDCGNLAGVRNGLRRFGEEADEGGDMITMHGDEIVETADNGNCTCRDAKLFFGFAQSGGSQIIIRRFRPSTREGDLAAMVAQCLGAPGKEEDVLAGTAEQREEDRRRAQQPVLDAPRFDGGEAAAQGGG